MMSLREDAGPAGEGTLDLRLVAQARNAKTENYRDICMAHIARVAIVSSQRSASSLIDTSLEEERLELERIESRLSGAAGVHPYAAVGWPPSGLLAARLA